MYKCAGRLASSFEERGASLSPSTLYKQYENGIHGGKGKSNGPRWVLHRVELFAKETWRIGLDDIFLTWNSSISNQPSETYFYVDEKKDVPTLISLEDIPGMRWRFVCLTTDSAGLAEVRKDFQFRLDSWIEVFELHGSLPTLQWTRIGEWQFALSAFWQVRQDNPLPPMLDLQNVAIFDETVAAFLS
jgi:hypothetical protein